MAETSALLPTEMKDEKPRLRSAAFSRRASPSAPLWEEKPIDPGGSARDPNVAFSEGPATAMPRQFGPDEPPAVRTDCGEQALLSLATLGARSRQSRPR